MDRAVTGNQARIVLLCHALNPALPEPRRRWAAERYAALSEADWRALFLLADDAMLLPTWFVGLRDKGWLAPMPQDLAEAAEAAWLLNRARNLRLTAEARQISRWLSELDIPAVHLKGMGHVLSGLHEDVGARMTGDLDILVPEDRVGPAARHLISKGASFVRMEPDLGLSRLRYEHHLPAMRLDGWLAAIDLHFAVCPSGRAWPPVAQILAEARPVQGDPHVLVPRPEHALALAVAHSLIRPPGLPGLGTHLKDVFDATAFVRTGADLDLVRRNSHGVSQRAATETMLHMTAVFFGARYPPPPGTAGWLSLLHRRCAMIFVLDNRGVHRALAPVRKLARSLRVTTAWSCIVNPSMRRHLSSVLFSQEYRHLWRRRRGIRYARH